MKRTNGVLLAVLPLLLSSCSYFLDLDSSSSSFFSSLEESSSSLSSSLEDEESSFELRTPSPVAVVGDSFNLRAVLSAAEAKTLSYVALEGGDLFEITSKGYFTALKEGTAVIEAKTLNEVSNQVTIEIVSEDENPYQGIDVDSFYDAYVPATSAADAYFRSLEGLMSGDIEVPDKETVKAANQPMEGATYVKNSTCLYEDEGATYCLLDAEGNVYEKIYILPVKREPFNGFPMTVFLGHNIICMHFCDCLLINAHARCFLRIAVIFPRSKTIPLNIPEALWHFHFESDPRKECGFELRIPDGFSLYGNCHRSIPKDPILVSQSEAPCLCIAAKIFLDIDQHTGFILMTGKIFQFLYRPVHEILVHPVIKLIHIVIDICPVDRKDGTRKDQLTAVFFCRL